MDRITEFLKDARPCFVATADGDQPCVRPQGFSMVYDGKLCFCTADGKATSKELKKNPKVEIAAVNGGKFIRIRGKAQLEKMIGPGKFEIFAVTGGTAVIADLASGEAETIEF